ncbi:tRNA (guanosine(37)-N1)-methyltransferase TrmD [Pseudoprimorskyibacter insulae]|uniref:tRNA (guanine-N(1)-)-methyltransferase n=1 Tax=Pseudoprimorskyibacter insulae TaxID=1695997 RepID=A0A2R8ANJ9_9RHOB|nr:tRNA (guanosine(37)-N1)-methyltransferase TrmD [Pseudoprimorskyibacter insulae]SPF77457.1 tRNA (guanine-N(1)-)-methyltransferase [Pseudoprimorskyibacter insulae]
MTDSKPKSFGRKSISASLKPRELMTNAPNLFGVWTASVVTLFPEAFPGVLGLSLTGKALQDGRWQLHTTNLRDFGDGKHRNVDDTPAGGGAGMVLRPDVMGKALEHAAGSMHRAAPILMMSPRGVPFTQRMAQSLAEGPGMTMICGRFEGLDQRVIDHYGITEVSLGDFVMTGGELAAQAMLDATVRLLPGVLGNADSIEEESHSNGLLEHPQYTRPAEWKGHAIPEVLLSGHHERIAQWRLEQARDLTRTRRPDMWAKVADKD